MNWEAIGALSDLLGAVAVVVTLVLLLIEMREGRKIAQAASVDALSAGWNQLNTTIFADPELNTLWFQGMNDPRALDDEQLKRFMMVCQSYVNHFMTVKKRYEAGHLPDEEWEYHAQGMSHLMNTPGGLLACEMVAITPSVLAEFEKRRGIQLREGFLGIKGSDEPTSNVGEAPSNKSVESDT